MSESTFYKLNGLIIGWFVLKGVYLSVLVPPGYPPDELFHIQVVALYAESDAVFPFSSTNISTYPAPRLEYAKFGPMAEAPYLYHLTAGKLVRLFGADPYAFGTVRTLRLLNVALGGLFLIGTLLFCRSAGQTSAQATVTAGIISSLLMLTATCSSVSYDPIVLSAAALSVYLWIRVGRHASMPALLACMCALGIGSLSKISFLPLGVMLCAGIVIVLFKQNSWNSLLDSFRRQKATSLLLLACLAPLVALNGELYLGNVLRYQTLLPPCEDIFPSQHCRAGFDELFHKMRSAEEHAGREPAILSRLEYSALWIDLVFHRSLGIYSHRGVAQGEPVVVLVQCVFGVALLALIFFFRKLQFDLQLLTLLSFAYMAILIQFHTFPYYLLTAVKDYAINGRYVFPILPQLVAVLVLSSSAFLTAVGGARVSRTAGSFVLATMLSVEGASLFLSPTFRSAYLAPPTVEFYESLSYAPNPIYDENFELRSRP